MAKSIVTFGVAVAVSLACAVAHAQIQAETIVGSTRTAKPPGTSVTPATELETGDAVLVEWGGQWWGGEVLEVLAENRVKIRYDGWGKDWDEAVARERVRLPAATTTAGYTAGQATGPPNVARAADDPASWTTRNPDGGLEWLKLEYEKAVPVAEVRIRESYNPGAISKVTARDENGETVVLWEGTDPTTKAPDDFVVTAEQNVTSRSIILYVDTKRKSGWNEIDAVELVGRDGTRQWANSATASSSYGSTRSLGYSIYGYGGYWNVGDPLAQALGQKTSVHVDDTVIDGQLKELGTTFLLIEGADGINRFFVNRTRISYIKSVAETRNK